MIPHRFEFCGQLSKLLALGRERFVLRLQVLLDAPLKLFDALQGLVPATLQLVGYQAVVGVGRIVLLLSTPGSIACRFQVPAQYLHDLVFFAGFLFVRQDRRLRRCGLHHTHDLACDGLINSPSTKGDTAPLSRV